MVGLSYFKYYYVVMWIVCFYIFITGSLQILAAQEQDEGKYECVALNEIGIAYSYPAHLYVKSMAILTLI